MSTEVQRLAALVAQLQGDVATLSRERRLSHASLEGGGINVYQTGTQGRPGVKLGEQYDGSYAPVPLGGPTPPMPAAPSATGGVERLAVRWDGIFASGPLTVAPQDWARVEVHVSTDPTPGVLFDTLRGTIESPRGGELSVMGLAPDTDYYVWLVSRSQAGKFSDPSQVVGPVRVEKLAVPEIDLSEIGGNTIYRGPDVPVPPEAGHKVGDLWLQTPDNIAHRWEGDPGSWVQSADQRIATALDEAFTANQAAEQAGIDALAARDTAGTAQTTATDAVNTANSAAQQAATAIQNASNAAALADSKVAAYYSSTPPTGLVAGDVGDLWFDTANGNRVKRWDGDSWEDISDVRVATALVDAANANTAAGNAQSTANTKVVTFYQTEPPATTGRTTGDLWVDTNDGNKLYRWSGSAWVAVPFGAGAISATARQLGAITTYKQAAAPTSGMIVGDFWIRSSDNRVHRWNGTTWEESKDAEINTAVTNAATAQATADGKVRIFAQADAPTGMTAGDVGDLWIETDAGNKMWTWSGSAWVARPLGNAAIEPKSLVARDVIATGTVSAALLESVLVLATTIVAGNINGDHARMTSTGFRVFQADPVDGVPNEVVRMGTDTSDYFGVVNGNGALVAAIDNEGNVSGSKGSFRELVVAGQSITQAIDTGPRGEVASYVGSPGFELAPIFNPVGIAEVGLAVYAGRSYTIKWQLAAFVNAGVQQLFQARVTYGNPGDTVAQAPAPTITTPIHAEWKRWPVGDNKTNTVSGECGFTPQSNTRVRVGLSTQTGPDGAPGLVGIRNLPVELTVIDNGPVVRGTGQSTNMGGSLNGQTSPPPPVNVVESRFVDLEPAGWAAVRGDGSTRTDVPGPVQGWDPSGYNGNGRGHWYFNMPNITGTITRMDFYAYSQHWYNNNGGTAIFNIATGSTPYVKPFADWPSPGWPKPGGREVLLPSEWYPYFRSAGAGGRPQANGITVGPGPDNGGLYYGRFDGPSARLRIHYTQ